MALREPRVTPPSECALAFVIPTDEAEFARDLRRGPDRDFTFDFAGRPDVVDDGAVRRNYDLRYRPEVEVIADVVATASPLGVGVIRGLDPADLGELCRRFSVINLVAHWKPANVYWDDVRDPIELAARLGEGRDPIWAAIRGLLSPEETRAIREPGVTRRRLQGLLADALNRFVMHDGVDPEAPRASRDHRTYRNRDRLDAAVSDPRVLEPGNRVEFSDGRHAVNAVVARLPADFDGVLDLSVCYSVFLAEAVRRRCPRCRRIIANEDATAPRFRLLVYKYVYKLLAAQPYDYLAVLGELRERLAAERRRP